MIKNLNSKSKLFSYDSPNELESLNKMIELISSKMSQKEPLFVVTTNMAALNQVELNLGSSEEIAYIRSQGSLTGKEKLLNSDKKVTTHESLLAAMQQNKTIVCTQATLQALKKKTNAFFQKAQNYSLIYLGDPKLYEYYSYNIKDLAVMLWSNTFALANIEEAKQYDNSLLPFKKIKEHFRLRFHQVYEVYRGNANDKFNKNIITNDTFNSLFQANYAHDLYLEPKSVALLERYIKTYIIPQEEDPKSHNKRFSVLKILSPLISCIFKEIYTFNFNFQASNLCQYYKFFGFDFYYIDIDNGKVSLRDTPIMSNDDIRKIIKERVIMGHDLKGKVSQEYNVFSFARQFSDFFSKKNQKRFMDPTRMRTPFSFTFWNQIEKGDPQATKIIRKYNEELLTAWQRGTRIAKSDRLSYVAIKQSSSYLYLDNGAEFIQKYPTTFDYKESKVKGMIYAHCANPSPCDHIFFNRSVNPYVLSLTNLVVNIFRSEPLQKGSNSLHLYVTSPYVADNLKSFCEHGSPLIMDSATFQEKIIQQENFEQFGNRVHTSLVLREKMSEKEYWGVRNEIKKIMIDKRNKRLSPFSHRSLLGLDLFRIFVNSSRSEIPHNILEPRLPLSLFVIQSRNETLMTSENTYSSSFPKASFRARPGKVREQENLEWENQKPQEKESLVDQKTSTINFPTPQIVIWSRNETLMTGWDREESFWPFPRMSLAAPRGKVGELRSKESEIQTVDSIESFVNQRLWIPQISEEKGERRLRHQDPPILTSLRNRFEDVPLKIISPNYPQLPTSLPKERGRGKPNKGSSSALERRLRTLWAASGEDPPTPYSDPPTTRGSPLSMEAKIREWLLNVDIEHLIHGKEADIDVNTIDEELLL